MESQHKKGALRAICLLIAALLPSYAQSTANAEQYGFSSILFTNCGASGANGPTLANCLADTNYSTKSWTSNVSNFNVIGGIQYWTVPSTGEYRITAAGAQGGFGGSNAGGKGVVETSTVSLTEGEVIRILVGQKGGASSASHGSGGGGTFVIRSPYDTNTAIIMIAGGGGGYGASGGGVNMQGQTARNPTSSSGNAGSNGGGGANASQTSGGGNGFVAGSSSGGSTWASGGAGFGGNGGSYAANSITGPKSFINGGTGGVGTTAGGYGGFGGGGGAGDRGAGGGGYSGGGGGNQNTVGGDGGGSFITGTNQQVSGGANSGHGYVFISRNGVPANLSMSVPAAAAFRTTVTLTLSSDSPGNATFYSNNKKISGCITITLSGTASNYSVQCNWKPATRGVSTIYATQNPSNGNLKTTSSFSRVTISQRAGLR